MQLVGGGTVNILRTSDTSVIPSAPIPNGCVFLVNDLDETKTHGCLPNLFEFVSHHNW